MADQDHRRTPVSPGRPTAVLDEPELQKLGQVDTCQVGNRRVSPENVGLGYKPGSVQVFT